LKNPLRAAWSVVNLTGREVVATHPRVEPKSLPFRRQPDFLNVVSRVEPADHPAFAFDDSQPHDDRESAFLLKSSLFQARSTLRLIILIHKVEGRVGLSRSATMPSISIVPSLAFLAATFSACFEVEHDHITMLGAADRSLHCVVSKSNNLLFRCEHRRLAKPKPTQP